MSILNFEFTFMELYRISQEKYAGDLSGNGSRLFGGRWNSEGMFALYASSSRSLALLETLAHTPSKMLHSKVYFLISLFVPDKADSEQIKLSNLLPEWQTKDTPFYTRGLGDAFLNSDRKLLLEVPSIIVPEEINYVLNPLHKEMSKVKVVHKRRIVFDSRIRI